MKKVWIQIGTHNGKDTFNQMVREKHPDRIILVEPNALLNSEIIKNYVGVESFAVIVNNAITEKEKGVVRLVIPKGKPHYSDKNYSLLPMDDWGDNFQMIEVPSMTFMQLCERYNITDIDFLQIDTEGYDAEIIKSIDFNQIHIRKIKYEKWAFDINCFKRYGEDANKYGINGMNEVAILLKSLGYVLIDGEYDITAVKVLK
jgi:FkbM family methyltransferase